MGDSTWDECLALTSASTPPEALPRNQDDLFDSGLVIGAGMDGVSAKEVNCALLSALRKAQRKTAHIYDDEGKSTGHYGNT